MLRNLEDNRSLPSILQVKLETSGNDNEKSVK